MAYHKNKIPKGKIGEVSKITEEYLELLDAIEQGDKILTICELSDMIGAIELYVRGYYDLTLEDLIKFSRATQQAFIDGERESK